MPGCPISRRPLLRHAGAKYTPLVVKSQQNRPTPPCLLALGRDALPEAFSLGDDTYRLERVFKHDFFAATALYAGDAGKVVLKLGRRASFFGVPLAWIGRLHVWHESVLYTAVADLGIAPAWLGYVGRGGFVHAYADGHPLKKGEHVPDDFFPRLRSALEAMHARKLAYVDLEKCENVIVGVDGRPQLIDFQISWRWPFSRGGDAWPVRWLRQRLQRADFYHLTKLQRRTRRDQLSPEALAASYRKPLYVRIYGRLTRPITLVRRRILNRVDPKQKRGERGRVE